MIFSCSFSLQEENFNFAKYFVFFRFNGRYQSERTNLLSNILSKAEGSTPQPEREVRHEIDMKLLNQFLGWKLPSKPVTPRMLMLGLLKRARSETKVADNHILLLDVIVMLPTVLLGFFQKQFFVASTRFSYLFKLILMSLLVICLRRLISLADLVVKLASRVLLIGKAIKEESIRGISSSELEKLKKRVGRVR